MGKDNIWILVYTKPNQETRANDNLRNQGFKTFLPLINSSNRGDSKILKPVFPRYIFVRLNLNSGNWNSIKSSYGVSGIVMFGEEFTPIPYQIIKSLKKKLDAKDIYEEKVLDADYKEGDKLTIKEGKFAGIEAIFLSRKSKDRVRLLLNLLNTQIVSEISISDIGSKEIIKNFKF